MQGKLGAERHLQAVGCVDPISRQHILETLIQPTWECRHPLLCRWIFPKMDFTIFV